MQQHRQHAELLSTPSAFCPRSLKMRAALVTVAGASDINRHLVLQLNVASLPSPSPPRPFVRPKKARLLYIYGDCKGGKRRLLLQPLREHGAERAFVLRRAFTPRERRAPRALSLAHTAFGARRRFLLQMTSYGTSRRRRRRRRRQKSAFECPYNCYRNNKCSIVSRWLLGGLLSTSP